LSKELKIIAKKHKQWVDIVQTFGCNRNTAEDLVQEMYIKVKKIIDKDQDIMFNEDEENYFYIYKTLKSLFLDLKRKEQKVKVYPLEDLHKDLKDSEYVDYDNIMNSVQDELGKQFWYDKKVFEIIDDGESISELSRKTNISYYSLYNTYKKVKKILRKLL
jgi:hypothetical protein